MLVSSSVCDLFNKNVKSDCQLNSPATWSCVVNNQLLNNRYVHGTIKDWLWEVLWYLPSVWNICEQVAGIPDHSYQLKRKYMYECPVKIEPEVWLNKIQKQILLMQ